MKKREERSRSGMKMKWGSWKMSQMNFKILRMRKLERGMVS